MAFHETPRFPDEVFRGAVRSQRSSTDITSYGNGKEQRNKNWPDQLHSFQIPRTDNLSTIRTIQAWHTVMDGAGDGFRVRDLDDYKSTLDMATAVAATDQDLGAGDGSAVDFQLIKTYSVGAITKTRDIKKPVSGTVKVAIDSQEQVQQWTVDTTTGLVTFDANQTSSVTAISQASQAVIDFSAAHGLSVDDTFHIDSVTGMTEINGLRGKVVTVNDVDTVTVDINSSAFTAYTSGGTTNTIPQTGETVKAGYEFDVPVRFDNDRLDTILTAVGIRELPDLVLVEYNP